VEPVTIKRFEDPDEQRAFALGSFALSEVGGVTVGLASYEPGWRWSRDVGGADGAAYCDVEHVGYVLSGRAGVRMRDGEERVLAPGDLFSVLPGHDSWVIGDEPYVSLHLMGAERYATHD
jgi:uncharacterized cupin superfamily protein